jgi:hypothetical protein
MAMDALAEGWNGAILPPHAPGSAAFAIARRPADGATLREFNGPAI